MRITSGSDWRDAVPFDTPLNLADFAPGDPTRCAVCGPASAEVVRDQLWVVKHRHPKQHAGYVRFYCDRHVPAPAPAPVVPEPVRAGSARSARSAVPRAAAERAPRRPAVIERPRAVCPNCFMEVPPTGICGSCGEHVA